MGRKKWMRRRRVEHLTQALFSFHSTSEEVEEEEEAHGGAL